jgi:formylglycine-generating enzyme required for sulfatase activity
MSQTTDCLIQQTNCGRIAGNPICPKCGLSEQMRYTTEEAVVLAKSQASASYWQNDATEVVQRNAAVEAERKEIERIKAEAAKRQAEKERVAQEGRKRLTAEQATRNPGEVFQDLPIAPAMVVLPSGSFLMGAESTGWLENVLGLRNTPTHKVTIAHQLAMGRYPVTFEEWAACVVDGGVSYKPKDKGDKLPVSNVSWEDAQAYATWLNTKLGMQANDPFCYRLPSEAEWEYACRAGSQTQWCFGDDEKQLEQYGWYSGYSGRHPVGGKKANAFGLSDMHGNVWEWVQDWYHDTYSGAPSDGSAWVTGGEQKHRILRGGSWMKAATLCRSASRNFDSPGNRDISIGFRLARTLP